MFGYSKNAVDNKLKAMEQRINSLETRILILEARGEDQKRINTKQAEYNEEIIKLFNSVYGALQRIAKFAR